MNMEEYKKVENFDYQQYCDYLKTKYGKAPESYFSETWVKNRKVSRTKEGLICHHIDEDKAIRLSDEDYAKRNPREYQDAEHLCYCDYLEHLYLHTLICEHPSKDHNTSEVVGIGGVTKYLIPELNDFYSGYYPANSNWKKICYEFIKDDKDVYLELVKRFKHNCKNYPLYKEDMLYTSFNAPYGYWDDKRNYALFEELKRL